KKELAGFKVISQEQDDLGFTKVKLQQKFKGVPVFGSVINAHVGQNGVLMSISGNLAPELYDKQSLKKGATLKADAAVEKAAADLKEKIGSSPELEAEAT